MAYLDTNCDLLGNSTMSLKIPHRDLDIVHGHPSMFYFLHLSWSMSIVIFFTDFWFFFRILTAQFGFLYLAEILMPFRKLTYWCSLKSQFQASISCNRSTSWSFYKENRRKTQKQRKNPAGPILWNAKFTSTLDRFGCVTFGFSISWIRNLGESVFFLHRNYLYSHLEWSFLRKFEKILHGKVCFLAYFCLLWFNNELLCSSRVL